MALHGRRALGVLLALSGLFCTAAWPAAALPDEPGAPTFTVQLLDAEGHPDTLAGSHPDRLQIEFGLGEASTSVRDLEIDLPAGLDGSSTAVPQCPRAVVDKEEECPPESQVGRLEVTLAGGLTGDAPLFELEPRAGEVLAIGSSSGLGVPLESKIRLTDFGVTLTGHDLPEGSVADVKLELWGIPADHQEGTTIPRHPFLTVPTTCGPVEFALRARSWQEGAQWTSASADAGSPLTGCEELSFEPSLGFQVSDPTADSPTGLQLDLNMPGEAEGSERAPAQARNVAVEFPNDIAISPGGAEGLAGCSDAQFGLGDGAPPRCPAQSQLGTVELLSDGLGGSLKGAMYIGEERPGQRLRSLVAIAGPGITFKFVNAMQVDPATGRLSTVMRGLPQVPIQRITLSFAGGPKALFATPLACGRVSADASFEPYGGGPSVRSSAPVTIRPAEPGAGCRGAPFSPQLSIDSSAHGAGQVTTLTTRLVRRPGEQLLRAFSTTLPAGLSTRLGTVQPCPDAAATLGACSLQSRVGSALAKIGSGSSPIALRGDVYLTGPDRRTPFGLLTEFRGALGPLDLGTIATRARMSVNRRNGKVTVVTAGMPDQVEGLPVRFQGIELTLDRPGFVRNPTSCSASSAEATLESQSGALASASSPLEIHGCRRLGFKLNARLALVGRDELHKRGTPVLRVTAKLPSDGSALRAMKLFLPPALTFRSGNVEEICSQPDAEAGLCSSSSRVGTALARTPLLNKPLRGSIHVAQPDGNGLPDMWMGLEGAGVRVDMRGRTRTTRDGRVVSDLSGLPDMPMSTFIMRLGTGKAGAISLGVDPCVRGRSRRLVAGIVAVAQNGRRKAFRVPIEMKARCGRSTR
ncbi:MAG: hypothetical protein ACRDLL_08795 [Solirubrobacterales bacterium]